MCINDNLINFVLLVTNCVMKMVKHNKARFGLTMSPELFEKIDAKRGLIPRATYIEYCVKQYFQLDDLKNDELKFYGEIQDTLLKLMSEEKRTAVLTGIGWVTAKIGERRESLIAAK
jgi:hypothetical protein